METPIGNSTEKPTRVVSGYGATRPEAFHKCFIRQLEREIQRDPPELPWRPLLQKICIRIKIREKTIKILVRFFRSFYT